MKGVNAFGDACSNSKSPLAMIAKAAIIAIAATGLLQSGCGKARSYKAISLKRTVSAKAAMDTHFFAPATAHPHALARNSSCTNYLGTRVLSDIPPYGALFGREAGYASSNGSRAHIQ